MIEKMQVTKSKIISYGVFLFALSIVSVNLISLIFPALLLTSTTSPESHINPFQIGAWTVPFLAANLAVLAFGLIYYKHRLPSIATRAFRFILRFEVSRKTAIVSFAIILGIYIVYSSGELTANEEDVWDDWKVVGPIIDSFPDGGEDNLPLRVIYVNNFLLYGSQEILQNVKVIPFIASISLVFVTYFLTVKLSKKRFAGLVATIVLLQSHTFLRYDTTATYTNFWTVFYLASLYLVYKKWPLSPVSFIASIFSKALSIAFIPMTLFFVLRSNTKSKHKLGLVISYLAIIGAAIAAMLTIGGLGYSKTLTEFNGVDFVSGFTSWAFQLRIDGLVLVFLLPLVVGLFIKSQKGFMDADSILVLIAGVLISVPLLAGFTQFNIQPYRWIPLIAFFAIGVGMLLSKSASGSED
ncbi:MAG: hypothetical protein WD154_02625 [Nitrosopumilaceae archaeon]